MNKNILIIAGLGALAFLFLTKKAAATNVGTGTSVTVPQTTTQSVWGSGEGTFKVPGDIKEQVGTSKTGFPIYATSNPLEVIVKEAGGGYHYKAVKPTSKADIITARKVNALQIAKLKPEYAKTVAYQKIMSA